MLLKISDLDIEKIMTSGECFRLRSTAPGEYVLVALGQILRLRQTREMAGRDEVELFCTEEELSRYWWDYFDFDTDYGRVREMIDPSDEYLKNAAEKGRGIRILRQELWEIIITFLISQNNNIPRIRRSIDGLCRRFGRPISDGISEEYAFPEPELMFGITKEDLSGLSLGYRDVYITELVNAVAEGKLILSDVAGSPYSGAKEMLMTRKGIGKKVADCICLFGLHQTEAFPLDTHMNQILAEHYPDGFPLEKYGKGAGILQQYMFYNELKK